MPTVDPSLNYQLVLAPTETVAYRRKTAQGAFAAPLTVTGAKRRALTKGRGEVMEKAVTWHLWRERLDAAGAAFEPRAGDVIEPAAGEGYVVGTVEVQSLGRRYRLSTLRRAGG